MSSYRVLNSIAAQSSTYRAFLFGTSCKNHLPDSRQSPTKNPSPIKAEGRLEKLDTLPSTITRKAETYERFSALQELFLRIWRLIEDREAGVLRRPCREDDEKPLDLGDSFVPLRGEKDLTSAAEVAVVLPVSALPCLEN